jgi:hypothetical protein
MKYFPSFPVIVTTRVDFYNDIDRASFELLRFLAYRLEVVRAAMLRVEELRPDAADVSEL